jgi:hypothetical protein
LHLVLEDCEDSYCPSRLGNESDLRRRALASFGSSQIAETSADNHDAWSAITHGFHNAWVH